MTTLIELDLGTGVAPATEPEVATASRVKSIDLELRQELEDFIARHRLGQKDVGAQIGYSPAQVNKYLAKKFEGDVFKFEGAVREMMHLARVRASVQQSVPPFPTLATRQVANCLATLESKPMIGVITGDAGWGKTCGIQLHLAEKITTLFVSVNRCDGTGSAALVNALWSQIDQRGYKAKEESRGGYLVRKLRGSNRMLVIDNAHRLSPTGRQWICDFHDATLCPVALVGNSGIVPAFQSDATQSSRVGFYSEVSLLKDEKDRNRESELRPAVTQFLNAVWPAATGDLMELALKVARGPGHLRALWHQLSVAMRFVEQSAKREGSAPMPPADAFRAAHTKLVRNYSLDA